MFIITPVTHPTVDTRHPLLLLQSEHGNKYFFGKVAEGAQRCLTENKIRISKLKNMFLTGELDWSSIGGLPGMILTIADQGRDELQLFHGSPIINYIVSTWRYFVFRFGISLNTHILPDKEIYNDDHLNVKSIVIEQPRTEKLQGYDRDLFSKRQNQALQSIVSNMFPKHAPTAKYDPSADPYLNVKLPEDFYSPKVTTSYEISFNPIRGRFKIEEAIKLGIPKGPLFAKLAKGGQVTLEDGTTVTPDQVLEKERHFAKVLILDIPDDSYIPSFLEKFKEYDSSEVGLIYYFLGNGVSIDASLIAFMELFNENAQHHVSHSKISSNEIVFAGAAFTTLKLKALQNDSYNLPRTDRVYSKEFFNCFNKDAPQGATMVQTQEETLTSVIRSEKVHVHNHGNEIQIDPFTRGEEELKVKLNRKRKPEFNWSFAYNRHIKPLSLPIASYDNVIKNQINVNNFNNTEEKKKHVEVITLGTGSALPSKYRNVVSTLVKLPYQNAEGKIDSRIILLDAGENTLGTISRMFSSIDCSNIFKDLKMIYLSHLHADHHLGIISLLKEWYKHNKHQVDSMLYIVTPWQYNKFVTEWLMYEEPDLLKRIKYISCEHLIDGSFVRMETIPITLNEFNNLVESPFQKRRKLEVDTSSSYRDLTVIENMYKDLKIARFQTCRAKHCHWAYSNSITFYMDSSSSQKLFKVSYSGDTRPNFDNFAKQIGYESDLLIHEATLDNELIEDAIKKRHCTINEAIEVSNEMKARKLILTHFSQRYPKLPQMDNNITIKAKEFCFAFDGYIVDYEKIGDQQKVFSYLNKVFIEEEEEDKTEKNNE